MNDIALPEITNEQMNLIKNTIAKDATKDELGLFLYDCKRRGVHPLDRKIHFSIRKDKDGSRRYTPLVAIDFMRERADATGELMGISEPEFTGKPKTEGFTAKVTVKRFRHGQIIDFVGIAKWEEFYPGDAQGFMWRKMPHNQLAKCAEAQALRKAFSAALAGIYLAEEFEMSREEPVISPQNENTTPDTWIMGKYLGIKEGKGGVPAKVRLQTDDGVMECELFNYALVSDLQENDAIRFQYTKNGKFRPLVAIEKIEISEAPPQKPEEPKQTAPQNEDWEIYALMSIEQSGKWKTYSLEDANGSIVAQTQYPLKSCKNANIEDFIGYDVQVKLTKRGDKYYLQDMKLPELESQPL